MSKDKNTVDFGIDLGTTNSCIAILKDGKPEIIENNDGDKYTPSAVGIKKGKIYVGKRAINMANLGDQNAYKEFKLQMGTSYEYEFPSEGVRMTPVELSAEVLKSLKKDVMHKLGMNITNVVISVPAAFNTHQTTHTMDAAEKAGFFHTYLINEPVAAAIAYGSENVENRTVWLIYDFGGGTFDAAVIQLINDEFRILEHKGDNMLGGKLIDWDIVNKIFVPALKSEYNLTDFNRGNPKWKVTFAKLKKTAEEAKIGLSRDDTVDIFVEALGVDDDGQWITFEYELQRKEIIPIIEPYVERSVNICKEAIKNSKIRIDDIDKVIMVGGTTLSSLVREKVQEKLQIPLEHSIDPLTVVTRGAAIFAGTQANAVCSICGEDKPLNSDMICKDCADKPPAEYKIITDFEATGSDIDPIIEGKIEAKNISSLDGFKIEFVEMKSQWRTGEIGIDSDNSFITDLRCGRLETVTYEIKLADNKGYLVECEPKVIKYTHIDRQPPADILINSIGIGKEDNTMTIFEKKGTKLPVNRTKKFRTTAQLKAGDTGELLHIPILEGEDTRRADSNDPIGYLNIMGANAEDLNNKGPAEGHVYIKRDLPAGSQVDVTLEVDKSRQINARAYIPDLDIEVEKVLEIIIHPPKPPIDLRKIFDSEMSRLNEIKDQINDLIDIDIKNQAEEILQKIDKEQIIPEIENSITAAIDDPDAANQAEVRLKDLKKIIDKIEDILSLPILQKELTKQRDQTRLVVEKRGESQHKTDLMELERQIEENIDTKDPALLHSFISKLKGLEDDVNLNSLEVLISLFRQLEMMISSIKDPGDVINAENYAKIGNEAINQYRENPLREKETKETLKGVNGALIQIIGIVPPPPEGRKGVVDW